MKTLGSPPYTCLITSGNANSSNFETEKRRILGTIRDAIEDGVSLIQIREKALPARSLCELVSASVDLAKDSPTLILVNDRADIAAAAGADGVHLPESSLPPEAMRRTFGNRLMIGVSTHSLKYAEHAADSGADYAFFGPVFDTPGKDPKGLQALREICSALHPFPVIALGGVDSSNAIDILAAGAAGIAAIRSLNDPRSRRDLMRTIHSYGNAIR